MENILAQSLQIIKDQFGNGIEIRSGDLYKYYLGFNTPQPDADNLVALTIWEFQRDNYKVSEDFSDRWDMTLSIYQKIKATDSVDEILALLKSLCFYLESQAKRPTSKGLFGKRDDGTITLSMTARTIKYDHFFEERVLSKVRPAINDLQQLKSLIPAQAKLESAPDTDSQGTTVYIVGFPELLTNSYLKTDLDKLLICLKMKNAKGENVWPQGKKAALWGVIDALKHKGYLVETTRIEYMESLAIYLNLKQSRIKDGYSKTQSVTKAKALSFLNQPVKE